MSGSVDLYYIFYGISEYQFKLKNDFINYDLFETTYNTELTATIDETNIDELCLKCNDNIIYCGFDINTYLCSKIVHIEEIFQQCVTNHDLKNTKYKKFIEENKHFTIYDKEYVKEYDDNQVINMLKWEVNSEESESDDEENDSKHWIQYYYYTFNMANYYRDTFTKRELVPFRKIYSTNLNCDNCQKESFYHCKKNKKIKFNVFLTSRTTDISFNCDIPGCACELNRFILYDYCEECFFNLPWYIPIAYKKLTLVKVLNKYNIITDLIIKMGELL